MATDRLRHLPAQSSEIFCRAGSGKPLAPPVSGSVTTFGLSGSGAAGAAGGGASGTRYSVGWIDGRPVESIGIVTEGVAAPVGRGATASMLVVVAGSGVAGMVGIAEPATLC